MKWKAERRGRREMKGRNLRGDKETKCIADKEGGMRGPRLTAESVHLYKWQMSEEGVINKVRDG